jgi:hypothetical protein
MTIGYPAEVNSVIYGLFRAPDLSREVAAGMAQAMVLREYFMDGPEAYSVSLKQALGQSDPVTADLEPPYDEDEVRRFLTLVIEELDKLKPWRGGSS